MREPLRRRISGTPPVITLLFVHGLMDADWLVEMQVLAAPTPAQG